jgi:hypothetical protein
MFVTNMPTGWMTLNKVVLIENLPPYPPAEGMQMVATFCSMKCLIEYSYVILATEGKP